MPAGTSGPCQCAILSAGFALGEGFGTLYTAVYRPREMALSLCSPGASWSLSLAEPIAGARRINYPQAA